MKFNITVNGKDRNIEAETAETAVRKEMSWYAAETIFTVKDENGKISRFKRGGNTSDLILISE